MAAYLATASVGDYVIDEYVAANGTPIFDAVDPTRLGAPSAGLALTSDMLVFFEGLYGPYPFVSYGAIVDDDTVGYALETQTRSFFSRTASQGTVAHELAHQWMGDHVSPHRWADIWLNEGWATYSTWMWTEHRRRCHRPRLPSTNTCRSPPTIEEWESSSLTPARSGCS